jgi:hypothetical protein
MYFIVVPEEKELVYNTCRFGSYIPNNMSEKSKE